MNSRCIVSGATSGIGRAITSRLASDGFEVVGLGRNEQALGKLAESIPGGFTPYTIDLTAPEEIREFVKIMTLQEAPLAALVHCAGTHHMGLVSDARLEDLDDMFRSNFRAVYQLTQALLPALEACPGDVVFINSTAGLVTRKGISGYSATQHALRALANGLREEVNELGIRVLSIYLGRTATARIERVFKEEGRQFEGEKLLQPESIADLVAFSIQLPRTAELMDVSLRPAVKTY